MRIDHIGLDVVDYEQSKAFYERALAPLGVKLLMEPVPEMGGFGGDFPFFWIGKRDRGPQTGVHVAFTAKDREMVDAFHAAALAAGGDRQRPAGGARDLPPQLLRSLRARPRWQQRRGGLSQAGSLISGGGKLTQQRWHVLAPLTGVLFVVLAVVAFIISGETPDTDDSPQKILDFYLDNDASQLWAGAVLAWSTVPLMFFLGVLRSTLRAEEGPVGRLSAVAFGGGIVLIVGALSFAGFTFTLGDIADDGLTPQAAQTLNALNSDFFFPVAVGVATLLIATGISSLGSRVLPAWLAWAALVIGIVALTPLGFFGFLAFLLWAVVTSVVLWRARAAGPTATAAPPPV